MGFGGKVKGKGQWGKAKANGARRMNGLRTRPISLAHGVGVAHGLGPWAWPTEARV